MSDRDPVDSMAPWTIKSVSVATRETVTKAARLESITVGQWLERRVADWTTDGSPISVPASSGQPGPSGSLGELAQLVQAAIAAAASAGVPVPPQFAKDAMLTARRAMRQARTLPPSRPSLRLPTSATINEP